MRMLRIEGTICLEACEDDEDYTLSGHIVSALRECCFPGASVEVEINSTGGSFEAARRIYDAMLDVQKAGGEVNVFISGLCASAASVVAMGGTHIKMRSSALYLLHNASMLQVSGNKEALMQQVKALEAIDENMLGIYCSRSKQDRSVIIDLMKNETFIDAKQAQSLGLCDEVVPDGSMFQPYIDAIRDVLESKDIAKVYAHFKNIKAQSQTKTMAKTLEELQSQLNTLSAEKGKLENEIASLRTENASFKEARAQALVDAAVKEGKIEESAKAAWYGQAQANYSATEQLLAGIRKPAATPEQPKNNGWPGSITAQLNNAAGAGSFSSARANWNARDWEINDPAGLEKMAQENPKQYDALVTEFYGPSKNQ